MSLTRPKQYTQTLHSQKECKSQVLNWPGSNVEVWAETAWAKGLRSKWCLTTPPQASVCGNRWRFSLIREAFSQVSGASSAQSIAVQLAPPPSCLPLLASASSSVLDFGSSVQSLEIATQVWSPSPHSIPGCVKLCTTKFCPENQNNPYRGQVFPKAFLSKTNVSRALSLKSLQTTNNAQHTLSVSLARAWANDWRRLNLSQCSKVTKTKVWFLCK